MTRNEEGMSPLGFVVRVYTDLFHVSLEMLAGEHE